MTRVAAASYALLVLLSCPVSAQTAGGSGTSEWRQSGVCYEIFVRSFYDSDGDGVGDLRGLTAKLDHVNDGDPDSRTDLGASCIWLMPVAQSPSYHGYDVTNYYRVNGDYGSNEDFQAFVAAAHERGIRVLVDLVLNHSSSEHPYFRSALLFVDSPYREWYHWSPAPQPIRGWGPDPVVWHRAPDREDYYLGLFWHGMPDLNLAHPAVRAEAERIARFWLEEMGVDGFRLDAVAHFFTDEDGSVRHAAANHPWLREYAASLERIDPDVFTIGEVWDSTGAIVPYYPDQLESYFIFEVSDALVEAARTGSAARLFAAVERAQRELPPGRWSPFLRNHDQTRTATDIGGEPARLRLAATLLLTLPGLPFLYYGEEIGMTGAKPDPRLRTPMHWSLEPAAGFTRGTPWEPLQPDSFVANVAAQHDDPASLLNHYRRLIHLRAAHPALGATGEFLPLASGHPQAAAYLRRAEDGGAALVLVNLGGERIPDLALSSAAAVLPAGSYAARPLLGEAPESTLAVSADGRVRGWAPVAVLEPFASHVLELTARD